MPDDQLLEDLGRGDELHRAAAARLRELLGEQGRLADLPIPCKGGDYSPGPDKIRQWRRNFPGLDLDKELRKARQWCEDQPVARRKTRGGMPRFLGQWLSRAYDDKRIVVGDHFQERPPTDDDLRRAFPEDS